MGGGGSQGTRIKVSKNASNGLKYILVSYRKPMENDPARPLPPPNIWKISYVFCIYFPY